MEGRKGLWCYGYNLREGEARSHRKARLFCLRGQVTGTKTRGMRECGNHKQQEIEGRRETFVIVYRS